MRFVTAAALAAIWMAAAAPVAAQTAWVKIGDRRVSDEVDRDTIRARGGEEFRQLMICVEQAPVRFHSITVRFQNGGTQDVRLRALVAAGRCSRFIDLRGRDRDVAAVDFVYESASLRGRPAQIELFAR